MGHTRACMHAGLYVRKESYRGALTAVRGSVSWVWCFSSPCVLCFVGSQQGMRCSRRRNRSGSCSVAQKNSQKSRGKKEKEKASNASLSLSQFSLSLLQDRNVGMAAAARPLRGLLGSSRKMVCGRKLSGRLEVLKVGIRW